MSEQIAPIQRDAIGNTTFEKVQTLEISVPDTTAPAAKTPSCGTEDGLNFSRPMKKFLVNKKSHFTAPPPAPEIQKQQKKDDKQQNPLETPGSRITIFG
jgi:hypothetical protein